MKTSHGVAADFFADAMNVLKSFIGSNYLVMPYAFAKSGTVLGIVGVVVIAGLTDRTCNLLVICKERVLRRISSREGQGIIDEELRRGVTYGVVVI